MTPDLTRIPTVRREKRAEMRRVETSARYMAHDRTGILNMRDAVTRDVKRDVHQSADRAFSLAWDFVQNNGWVSGAADQIIADMIGLELKLNCRPDLSGLGYSDGDRAAWCRLVEKEWRQWAWTPWECDLEGKSTIADLLDGAVRHYLVSGEAILVIDFLGARQRSRYGLETGTKARLVSPHRLSRHTSPLDGWDQGIMHDDLGRPRWYRFRQSDGFVDRDVDVPARDGALLKVVHAMDRGSLPNAPRGISPMAPAFRTIAQSDQLADATLTTALLQTAFAATIQSPEPSDVAFQALQQLADLDTDPLFEGAANLAGDFFSVWEQRIEALKSKSLSIGGGASQVNHLGPGENLTLHSSKTPGPDYQAFQMGLLREIARCLGVTVETLTMDFTTASYSSVRMASSSVWPTIARRRERIPAPLAQGVYEAWLDEMIGRGKIPFRGGYAAFAANRRRVVDSEWRGPAKPSADPYKDAMANKVKLESGQTTLQAIHAEAGEDWEEAAEQIRLEVERLNAAGIVPPHGRMSGGEGPGPMGGAMDGQREPSNA